MNFHTPNDIYRAVARSENPGGGHVVLGGDNVLPLVEIGLTDVPKTGVAPPFATGLFTFLNKFKLFG